MGGRTDPRPGFGEALREAGPAAQVFSPLILGRALDSGGVLVAALTCVLFLTGHRAGPHHRSDPMAHPPADPASFDVFRTVPPPSGVNSGRGKNRINRSLDCRASDGVGRRYFGYDRGIRGIGDAWAVHLQARQESLSVTE
ncbi:hypothetical protein B1H29_08915 [Streptomyces pactum]|uniref:Uncharacterized protein n=1 Tax=Streptomyces pactum TaxID=68249 RepID=A0A1S6J5K7_9ACTN|nr:hypothetical protein B1H29_08915 [Streptomyces pactum]